jgi:hypothetical protein
MPCIIRRGLWVQSAEYHPHARKAAAFEKCCGHEQYFGDSPRASTYAKIRSVNLQGLADTT